MKISIVKSVVVVASVLAFVGCDSASTVVADATDSAETVVEEVVATVDDNNTVVEEAAVEETVPTEVATSEKLSQELINTLAYMGNEERLAYDVYNELYKQYPNAKQFTNIATNGEYQHITLVQELIQKYKLNDDVNFTNIDLPTLGYMNTPIEDMEAGTYDIAEIQKLYDDLVAQGSTSEIDALKVGCIIEVVDVNDLTHDIALAQAENATEIVSVFETLRSGSYNHYWAFDDGLKKRGVADGCCALGTIDGVDYCHPEYPQK